MLRAATTRSSFIYEAIQAKQLELSRYALYKFIHRLLGSAGSILTLIVYIIKTMKFTAALSACMLGAASAFAPVSTGEDIMYRMM